MVVFSSSFWLWTIVGLVGLVFAYTIAGLLNVAGFMTPLRAFGRWIERSPGRVRVALVALALLFLAYPATVHKLWADATAAQIRQTFDGIPAYPGAAAMQQSEQMGGLYDPSGNDAAYILVWYGTAGTPTDVRNHFKRAMAEKGWVEQAGSPSGAIAFLDNADRRMAHYQVALLVPSPDSAQVPRALAGQPTAFALRLGAVDPSVTTQVSWLIDCLVQRAPTFPSCEPVGWSPLNEVRQVP